MAKLLFAIFMLLGLSSAVCRTQDRGKRRAWHTFSKAEKKAYIDAELCLMKKPATLGLKGTTNRHEEHQAAHQLQSYATHFVGGFLPFHRALLHAHETALRTECKYKGWQPYWEEQLDAGNFTHSVLLDPVTGFGGNGSGPNHCITDGPFASYINHLGPGYEYTKHCINRIVDETFSSFSSQTLVDACLAKPDFLSAWNCIERRPHQGGHGGMIDPIASPGDPLFYLHHTWLDKMWADWQLKGLPGRLTEMGGENVQIPEKLEFPFPARPSNIPQPTGAEGDPGKVTTLNHKLNMYGNGPNRTISDVMDIWQGVLCYEYVQPGYGGY
ncbi:hypothetical protein GQ44DRAFT_725108 [Phaeosphaeriaceae sp. PMI808]|nr:hypothetical protein GQ44DRAFT_725108 [Phaeosphaeriaceae sp. PMI808]